MLDVVGQALEGEGLSYGRLDGSMAQKAREKALGRRV